jgi:hypothetical protein
MLTRSSAKVNTLSNLYLSAKGGKVAAFAGQRESPQSAGKFFTSDYSPAGTLSFHAADNTHQLGLSGTGGFLNLVDLVNPRGDKLDPAVPTMWSVFQVGQGGQLVVKDGSNIPTRTWATYLDTDGVYYVGLWDGEFLCLALDTSNRSRCDSTEAQHRKHHYHCHQGTRSEAKVEQRVGHLCKFLYEYQNDTLNEEMLRHDRLQPC